MPSEHGSTSYTLASGAAPIWLHGLVIVRGYLRSIKRYMEADLLLRLLESCGVLIDDKQYIWTLAEAPLKPRRQPLPPDAPRCTACNTTFASRNLLFRHLRQDCKQSGMANADGELGAQSLRRHRSRPKPSTASDSTAAPKDCCVVAADRCLWVGELPAVWAARKPLEALFYSLGPRGLPQPWIKKVIRRPRRGRPYAIVAFRDRIEAELVMRHMDELRVEPGACGLEPTHRASSAAEECGAEAGSERHPPEHSGDVLPAFTLKVRPCENASNAVAGGLAERVHAGVDPPMEATLRPLSVESLWQRAEDIHAQLSSDAVPPMGATWRSACKHEALAAALGAYEAAGGRREVHISGHQVPPVLREALEREVRALRWPARSHREQVTSERYLVLHPSPSTPSESAAGKAPDEYATLRALCAELAQLAGSAFTYSGIAVTKNFVGSPHVDTLDTSWQLAVALGDFSEGGELCVDGVDVLYIINTRGRLSKVDGRHVHWVRGHSGGDRYSIILYDTTAQKPTPKGAPVDVSWTLCTESTTSDVTPTVQ